MLHFYVMVAANPYIYVVDDDASVSRMLRVLLEAAGFNVDTFSTAQSFLDSVPPEAQGCLVVDKCMPGIDGFKLLKKMNLLNYNLHIIFITGSVQAGDYEHAMEVGAMGFLRKPFNSKSLLDLISTITEKDLK